MNTCRNEAEAEDLVQDVFLVLVQKLFDIKKSLTAFAHGIMQNKCRQWIRQKRKTSDREEDEIQSSQPDPSTQTVYDEVFKVIEGFFNHQLEHWEIIRSNMIYKLSHADIAVQLGISEGASRTRLHRAVTALRGLCDKHNIAPDELRQAIKRYYNEMS